MKKQIALTVLAGLAACSQERSVTGPPAARAVALAASVQAVDGAQRAVYTLMNQVSGNAVAIFQRAADGTLTAVGTVATGGTGTGSGLGSQGALALSDDGRWLFAVNAGSNDVSILRVTPAGLVLTSRVPSGGTLPISLTVHGNLLYVLNGGGSGNIAGFALDNGGGATSIPGAIRPLSGPNVGPAEVAFSPNGRWLIVTEKNTNAFDIYAVGPDGVAGAPTLEASAGIQPFGFTFGLRNELFITEAASGSVSSYVIGSSGTPVLVSGAVPTDQAAPCWAAVTKDGRFVYTANAHAGTISGFAVGTDGTLRALDANGVTATVGAGNLDLAISENGRYLYQLRGNGPITALRVEDDGHLTILGVVGAMPGSVAGLAAR